MSGACLGSAHVSSQRSTESKIDEAIGRPDVGQLACRGAGAVVPGALLMHGVLAFDWTVKFTSIVHQIYW